MTKLEIVILVACSMTFIALLIYYTIKKIYPIIYVDIDNDKKAIEYFEYTCNYMYPNHSIKFSYIDYLENSFKSRYIAKLKCSRYKHWIAIRRFKRLQKKYPS